MAALHAATFRKNGWPRETWVMKENPNVEASVVTQIVRSLKVFFGKAGPARWSALGEQQHATRAAVHHAARSSNGFFHKARALCQESPQNPEAPTPGPGQARCSSERVAQASVQEGRTDLVSAHLEPSAPHTSTLSSTQSPACDQGKSRRSERP